MVDVATIPNVAVRNPLNGVAGHLRFMMDRLEVQGAANGQDETTLPLLEDVGGALVCTSAALSVLENMNSLNQLEAGLLVLEAVVFSPVTVLEHAVAIVKRQAARGVEVRLIFDEGENMAGEDDDKDPLVDKSSVSSQLVRGDPKMLMQILTNLATNAVKHTSKGFVELVCNMQVPAEAKGEAQLSFTVRDSGSGVPPSFAASIFDRYNTRGGTGLGLYLVRLQVKQLGGHITLRSPWHMAHGGSEFSFSIRMPLEVASRGVTLPPVDLLARRRPPTPAQSHAEQQVVASMGTASLQASTSDPKGVPAPAGAQATTAPLELRLRKLLIADDVTINRKLLERTFRKLGGQSLVIEMAETAEEVLRAAKASSFEVIVVDEIFSQDDQAMRGSDAIKKIREHEKNAGVPSSTIVSCTGNAAYIESELLAAGASLVWNKPYPPLGEISVQLGELLARPKSVGSDGY